MQFWTERMCTPRHPEARLHKLRRTNCKREIQGEGGEHVASCPVPLQLQGFPLPDT